MHLLNFSDPAILGQIKMIGYPFMLLVMIIEGPIMTILAAFTAKLGFFNVYVVFLLSILGDVIGDAILYYIGYSGGAKTLEKAERVLKIKPAIVAKIEYLFEKHGKKTIFAVKSTTGLCWITFIAAGAVRMNFKDFLSASILGGIVWSGFLVAMGYFFGYAFKQIGIYIKYAGLVVFLSAVVFYAAVTFYKKHQSEKILSENGTPVL
jgi:membrane protein DedA with SNARE-associated domain